MAGITVEHTFTTGPLAGKSESFSEGTRIISIWRREDGKLKGIRMSAKEYRLGFHPIPPRKCSNGFITQAVDGEGKNGHHFIELLQGTDGIGGVYLYDSIDFLGAYCVDIKADEVKELFVEGCWDEELFLPDEKPIKAPQASTPQPQLTLF